MDSRLEVKHTHILGETLCQHDLVSLLDEVADGVRVVVHVARREALVRHVEEREQLLLFDDLLNDIWLG